VRQQFRELGVTYVTLLITHICVQVDYQLPIVVDYPYYQLLLSIVVDYPHMCFIYVQVNMCDILRKTIARKAWAIAEVFPT